MYFKIFKVDFSWLERHYTRDKPDLSPHLHLEKGKNDMWTEEEWPPPLVTMSYVDRAKERAQAIKNAAPDHLFVDPMDNFIAGAIQFQEAGRPTLFNHPGWQEEFRRVIVGAMDSAQTLIDQGLPMHIVAQDLLTKGYPEPAICLVLAYMAYYQKKEEPTT